MVISGNISGSVSATKVGAGASKAIKSTNVLGTSNLTVGNSRVNTNIKGLNEAKALAIRMPGTQDPKINDGETAKADDPNKNDAQGNKNTEEKSKESGNISKLVNKLFKKEVDKDKKSKDKNKDNPLLDGIKNDQKINDKVTQDQAGRDITDPKSDRTEPNRLEQGNSELHGSRPQDSADFANKNKITGPDIVSPGEKGSETGSTPPSQGPLGAGSGNGAGMPGMGGGGGGGTPGAPGTGPQSGPLQGPPPSTGPDLRQNQPGIQGTDPNVNNSGGVDPTASWESKDSSSDTNIQIQNGSEDGF